MMALGSIFKMLGVKVPPATVAQIEALIPQIPTKANELIAANMAAIKNFDDRLQVLEGLAEQHRLTLQMILEEVQKNGRRAGCNYSSD